MKAVICTKYGPPEVLKLSEVSKPVPKDTDVLIKIHATAVTTSDCYVRGFSVSFVFKILMGLVIGFTRPRQPILGMVFSGEVESAGKNVTAFSAGDRVFGFDRFGFGTYSEFKRISEKGLITKIPEQMNYQESAAIPYGGLLALFYLNKGKIKSGQKVLICGASGAVGTSAVQLAKYFGAEVTGVCSTGNLELVKSLGADHVIDYLKEDYFKSQKHYDFILDAVPAGAGPRKHLQSQFQKILSKTGIYISVSHGAPSFKQSDLKFLTNLCKKGNLKAVIDRTYRLEQIPEAHSYVESWHKKGNVIIEVIEQ